MDNLYKVIVFLKYNNFVLTVKSEIIYFLGHYINAYRINETTCRAMPNGITQSFIRIFIPRPCEPLYGTEKTTVSSLIGLVKKL